MQIDPTLEELADRCAPVTQYAWRFRYPGDLDEPDLEDARAALDVARFAYRLVCLKLGFSP